ncbi:hypothetical protein [Nocardia tengchongensis]
MSAVPQRRTPFLREAPTTPAQSSRIAATTLGETGGDFLAQTLHLGYTGGAILIAAVMIAELLV